VCIHQSDWTPAWKYKPISTLATLTIVYFEQAVVRVKLGWEAEVQAML
jgi:hypothetical protein